MKEISRSKAYETVIPFDMGEDSGLSALQDISEFYNQCMRIST
jgi:hypothetical protein